MNGEIIMKRSFLLLATLITLLAACSNGSVTPEETTPKEKPSADVEKEKKQAPSPTTSSAEKQTGLAAEYAISQDDSDYYEDLEACLKNFASSYMYLSDVEISEPEDVNMDAVERSYEYSNESIICKDKMLEDHQIRSNSAFFSTDVKFEDFNQYNEHYNKILGQYINEPNESIMPYDLTNPKNMAIDKYWAVKEQLKEDLENLK